MPTEHLWSHELESGTTRTCVRCGCVRFSQDKRGRAVANARATRYRYQPKRLRGLRIDPPACEAT